MNGSYSVSKKAVTGWYFNADHTGSSYVDVFCEDMFLRRLRCNLSWPSPPVGVEARGACGFVLNITEQLADLLPENARILVSGVDGAFLPHRGENVSAGRALDGGEKLRTRLEEGWIVDKWGGLKLPFRAVEGLDQKFLDFYYDISSKLEADLGVQFYLCYGSLLGCIRDKRLIPFDDDIDAAYLSKFVEIDDVAREFHELRRSIQDVEKKHSIKLHVVDTGQMSVNAGALHFDIFTSWIDAKLRYNCYFGVSGVLNARTFPLKRIPFLGRQVTIPDEAERVLEWTYGHGWNVPDPHFTWVPAPAVKKIMDELRDAGRGFQGALKPVSGWLSRFPFRFMG